MWACLSRTASVAVSPRLRNRRPVLGRRMGTVTDFGSSPEFASMDGEPISRERPHGAAGVVAVAAAFNPANAPRLRALGAVQVLNVWWEGGFEPRRAEGLAARCAARFARISLRQRRPHRLAVRAAGREAVLRLSRRQQAVEYVLKTPARSYRPPIAVDGLWRANQDRRLRWREGTSSRSRPAGRRRPRHPRADRLPRAPPCRCRGRGR
jgi:hypothetical protein